ncbi:MAG: hypothetical protein PVI75_04855 [Gammaproteobacteria bacterium]
MEIVKGSKGKLLIFSLNSLDTEISDKSIKIACDEISLELGEYDSYKINCDKLVKIVGALNRELLDLSNNELFAITDVELAKIFNNPNLCQYSISKKTFHTLVKIVGTFNGKSLNLSDNDCHKISDDRLAKLVRAFKGELLNLSNNKLNRKTSKELVEIVGAFKGKSLNLNGNNLSKKTTDKLIKVVEAFKGESLNLSNNNLGKKTTDNLIKIFKAIPQKVATIKIDNNKLFVGKNAKEIDKILNALNYFTSRHSKKKNGILHTIKNCISYLIPPKQKPKQKPIPFRNIILNEDNGETDFTRALLPMLSATRSEENTFYRLPLEIIYEILSYLLPPKSQSKSQSMPTKLVENKIYSFFSKGEMEKMRGESIKNPKGKEAKTLKKLYIRIK